MAAPSKKRRALENGDKHETSDDEGHEDGDSVDDSSASENEMETEINVDFEARAFEAQDLPGVQNLLRQLLLDNNIVKDLSELLLQQSSIGCVIKQCKSTNESEDDDDDDDSQDVFGIISVVNITEKKTVPCVELLRSTLINKCNETCDKKTQELFAKLLNDNSNHVGLVICDRFINIPSKIAHPMYDSLRNDISAAIAKNMKYKFSHYIAVGKLYEPVSSMRQGSDDDYVNQEDLEFKTESLINFKFNVKDKTVPAIADEWDADEENEFLPFRQVSILTAEKWNKVIDKLTTLYAT